MSEPMSVHAILKAHGVVASSGVVPYRSRAALNDVIDVALQKLYQAAVERYGAPRAAFIMARLLGQAPPGTEGGYEPPRWLLDVLQRHRKDILVEGREDD